MQALTSLSTCIINVDSLTFNFDSAFKMALNMANAISFSPQFFFCILFVGFTTKIESFLDHTI